ncbi:MAG: hypothetical protein GXP45_02405 [bacterium]|nr:hypothetical protein [bacterium]
MEVQGNISSIYKNIPVIEVNRIKLPQEHLIITADSYFFSDDLLRFDFGKQRGFNAKKKGKKISIYFNDTFLASYEPFVCNKVVKSQNCEEMELDLKYKATENFISYDGYDYYRYGTGKWITFNDNNLGYIVTAINDERLLDLSSIVKIVNKEFVIANKNQQMKTACQSGDEKFLNIDEYLFQKISPSQIKMTLLGSSNRHYKAECDVFFDLRNKWQITKASLFPQPE